MQGISSELVVILQYLLPGFIAAWIFHALTSYPKPSQFERIIQALIFTALINSFVFAVAYIINKAPTIWSNDFKLIIASIIAVLFGVFLAFLSNTDLTHKFLRICNVTKETSYASEWFGVFSDNISYVTLHLKDGRRICGWPKEWPTEPNIGHFFLNNAFWLTEENEKISLDVIGILINSSDVELVEFLKLTKEN